MPTTHEQQAQPPIMRWLAVVTTALLGTVHVRSCSPAPTPKVVDVEAGTKGAPVVLPARLPTTRTRGTCPSFRAAEAVGDPTAAAEAATAAAEAIRHRRR